MSTQVFPTLPGQTIDLPRTAMWPESNIITAVSGKETAVAYQASPRYQWEIAWSLLRSGTRSGVAYTEMQQLMGFFNARRGPFDSFLFTDPEDYSATDSQIGVADNATRTFQLVRTFGSFVEPVLAPNVVTNVKVAGVTQSGGSYSVGAWGSATPGVVTFNVAPAAGAITSTFTFYWPCRFVEKSMTLSRFLSQMYEGRAVKIISLK